MRQGWAQGKPLHLAAAAGISAGAVQMRRAARTDANHAAIREALRKIGASVADTSGVGNGFPDMVVGFRGRNWILECKDGSKPPSARKLTAAQIEFKAGWRGHWAVVKSPEEAIEVVSR